MEYKKWFDELGESTPSTEKIYISDYDTNFSSSILQKQIVIGTNEVIDVYSTTSTHHDFKMIAIAKSDTDYSSLTDEEYSVGMIPELLTYFEYYIAENDWKFDYGDIFKKILENRYYFQSDLGNIGFFLPEHFFPAFVYNKDAFKIFMCIPLSDSECEYLKTSGQELLIKKLKAYNADVSDLFRESCI